MVIIIIFNTCSYSIIFMQLQSIACIHFLRLCTFVVLQEKKAQKSKLRSLLCRKIAQDPELDTTGICWDDNAWRSNAQHGIAGLGFCDCNGMPRIANVYWTRFMSFHLADFWFKLSAAHFVISLVFFACVWFYLLGHGWLGFYGLGVLFGCHCDDAIRADRVQPRGSHSADRVVAGFRCLSLLGKEQLDGNRASPHQQEQRFGSVQPAWYYRIYRWLCQTDHRLLCS